MRGCVDIGAFFTAGGVRVDGYGVVDGGCGDDHVHAAKFENGGGAPVGYGQCCQNQRHYLDFV